MSQAKNDNLALRESMLLVFAPYGLLLSSMLYAAAPCCNLCLPWRRSHLSRQ